MDRLNNRDSDGFFSRRIVSRCSDSPYSSTGSSLIIANYNASFFLDLDLLIQHGTHGTASYYVILCNMHSCGYSIPSFAILNCKRMLEKLFGSNLRNFNAFFLTIYFLNEALLCRTLGTQWITCIIILNNAHPSGGPAARAAAVRDFGCYMRFLTSCTSLKTTERAISWVVFERTTLE